MARFTRPPGFLHIFLSVGVKWLAHDSDIVAAEQQLYVACEKYDQIYGREEMWGITHSGSKFRIWAYQKGRPTLVAFFPVVRPEEEEEVFGKEEAYLDLVDSGPQFKRCWEYMIKNPQPDTGLFNAHHDWVKGNGSNECPAICVRPGFC
ncbi:hypothetical protein M441DRAFT_54980 [Trichoderma asperellum CBS 433.97]|uniref:Fungal-type protein kinase domain-containing protein n=1 Tax=Trichoderma asperellum (strain ATCC 204424 / CBS 433.97 / NBRC 101777) TaxID=1042311 RepID=A0A2T3ZGB0_TRIA4|nr:hypothetical protein M441DRAFT_54980 [Trichoderma asperellum CBS 433.97]PTB43845.1 hypothetical protein M441DRAFT_54980 [Trichoderma asperellum CBS 433.97]